MSDIPPPTTSLVPPKDTVWNAVPVPLTPLLGRDKEIDQICGLLNSQGPRFVTLTGAGGIGKTRLAIEVATQVAPCFSHGACFVALESVREPQHIAGTVAQALGLPESGDSAAQDALLTVLRDRHLLLVLDNAEYVVNIFDPWLVNLFAECPLVRVLVTSRIAVQIDGEQRFVVSPLPLPQCHTSEGMADNAAVMLFSQRARAINPEFILTTAQASVVAQICRRLDGLPLAIELAASRVTVLSPPAILTRLSDGLSILKDNRRDAPIRHRTMRDAIAWSYDLLPLEEQRLFRRLAVFIGGFTLHAAEAVGGPMTLDLLTMLVDHSLVRRLTPVGDVVRMGMYETTREFGLEQLIGHGDEAAARDVHAAYFLQMGVEPDGVLLSYAQLEWFAGHEGDQDNLGAAINWLARRGRIEEALKLSTDTMRFHWIRGLYTESLGLLESALAHHQSGLLPDGRAKALGEVHGSVPLLRDPCREKLAALEAVPVDADILAMARSALGDADHSMDFGSGMALELNDALRDAIEHSPSDVSAEAPGPPQMLGCPVNLTPRELEVLRLMADGLTNQEIGDSLFISLRTVTSHVTHVLAKLALTSRTAAASYAIRRGLI